MFKERIHVWGYAEALDRFSSTDTIMVHALRCSHSIQTLAFGDSRYSIRSQTSVSCSSKGQEWLMFTVIICIILKH